MVLMGSYVEPPVGSEVGAQRHVGAGGDLVELALRSREAA